MPSQREIRRRITSVRNIKQITRAMQFVAASKLRRAQESTLAARPYREKLDEVIADLAQPADRCPSVHNVVQAQRRFPRRAGAIHGWASFSRQRHDPSPDPRLTASRG